MSCFFFILLPFLLLAICRGKLTRFDLAPILPLFPPFYLIYIFIVFPCSRTRAFLVTTLYVTVELIPLRTSGYENKFSYHYDLYLLFYSIWGCFFLVHISLAVAFPCLIKLISESATAPKLSFVFFLPEPDFSVSASNFLPYSFVSSLLWCWLN